MASYQSTESPSATTTIQNRFSYPRNLSHNQYEEIVSWVECPTCKGSGKISKESEEEYIALIPLTDERLRPRRTLQYVGVTFLICAIVIIALVIFLMPRSIVLSSTSPYIFPSHTVIITGPGEHKITVDMVLANSVNLTNYNFFGITVTEIMMDIFVGNVHLKSPTANIDVGIPLRGTRQLSITGNLSLSSKTSKLLDYCQYNDYILRTIYMHFTFTVSSSYFGQTTQSTFKTVQGVDCFPTANRTSETLFWP